MCKFRAKGFKVQFWRMNLGSSEFKVQPVKFKAVQSSLYIWVHRNEAIAIFFWMRVYFFFCSDSLFFKVPFKHEERLTNQIGIHLTLVGEETSPFSYKNKVNRI